MILRVPPEVPDHTFENLWFRVSNTFQFLFLWLEEDKNTSRGYYMFLLHSIRGLCLWGLVISYYWCCNWFMVVGKTIELDPGFVKISCTFEKNICSVLLLYTYSSTFSIALFKLSKLSVLIFYFIIILWYWVLWFGTISVKKFFMLLLYYLGMHL